MPDSMLPDTPTDETPITEPGADVNQLSALSALSARNPALALVAVFLMAGGGGTVGSMYVAPLVDDALHAHEADERAHNIDRLEERLDTLEGKIDAQGRELIEVKAGVDAAVRILEGP